MTNTGMRMTYLVQLICYLKHAVVTFTNLKQTTCILICISMEIFCSVWLANIRKQYKTKLKEEAVMFNIQNSV